MRLGYHSMHMREITAIQQENSKVLQCTDAEENNKNGAGFGWERGKTKSAKKKKKSIEQRGGLFKRQIDITGSAYIHF